MDIAPDLTQFGWCPFAVLTGEPCILCGGTRATLSLVRGDFTAALEFNAVVSVAVVAIFVGALSMVALEMKIGGTISRGKVVARRIRAVPLWMQVAVFGIWWLWNIGRW